MLTWYGAGVTLPIIDLLKTKRINQNRVFKTSQVSAAVNLIWPHHFGTLAIILLFFFPPLWTQRARLMCRFKAWGEVLVPSSTQLQHWNTLTQKVSFVLGECFFFKFSKDPFTPIKCFVSTFHSPPGAVSMQSSAIPDTSKQNQNQVNPALSSPPPVAAFMFQISEPKKCLISPHNSAHENKARRNALNQGFQGMTECEKQNVAFKDTNNLCERSKSPEATTWFYLAILLGLTRLSSCRRPAQQDPEISARSSVPISTACLSVGSTTTGSLTSAVSSSCSVLFVKLMSRWGMTLLGKRFITKGEKSHCSITSWNISSRTKLICSFFVNVGITFLY